MTILSGQSIRDLCGEYFTNEIGELEFKHLDNALIRPFQERTIVEGRSVGLSVAGYDISLDQDIVLRPGAFKLASTIEYFQMPDDLQAVVHDKSSYARIGIAVQNTVLEAGWRGFLTVELTNHWLPMDHQSANAMEYNMSKTIRLKRGMAIAQVLFHKIDKPVEAPYNGKYQDQKRGPQEAIHEQNG